MSVSLAATFTATVLVVANLVPPFTVAVTVTVFAPPFSVTVDGLADSVMPVGAASSSVRLNVSEVTVTPDKAPLTVTVSLVSSTTSLVGVNTNVADPDAASAAMVMLKFDTAAKSTAVTTPLPATLTTTVLAVANLVPPFTVAVTVTVFAPPFSATVVRSTMLLESDASVRLNVIAVGAASSSVRLNVSEVTVTPDKAPLTVTVSLVSSTTSLVGVNTNVADPDAASAAMVMLKFDTAAKSTAVTTPLPATLTTTVLAVANS